MQNRIHRLVELSIVLSAFGALGCAAEDTDVDTDTDVATADEALVLQKPFYDYGTQCTVGGVTMHCCPKGSVMVGIHVEDNVLKCAAPYFFTLGDVMLDGGTQRNGMHACPPGRLMVGVHVGRNLFACARSIQDIEFEYVDWGTQDSYPMHVCTTKSAMSGIHVANNQLTCAY